MKNLSQPNFIFPYKFKFFINELEASESYDWHSIDQTVPFKFVQELKQCCVKNNTQIYAACYLADYSSSSLFFFFLKKQRVFCTNCTYITLVVGYVVTAVHAKELAGICCLDFAAGMIADENILMSRPPSRSFNLEECMKRTPFCSLLN